nr:hypothetical protein Itr_chr04CG10880 [Ipomoea trifida]
MIAPARDASTLIFAVAEEPKLAAGPDTGCCSIRPPKRPGRAELYLLHSLVLTAAPEVPFEMGGGGMFLEFGAGAKFIIWATAL